MQNLQVDDLDYLFLSADEANDLVNEKIDDFGVCAAGFETAFSEMLDALEEDPENFYVVIAQDEEGIVAFRYGLIKGCSVSSGWCVVLSGLRKNGIAARIHAVMLEHLSEFGVNEVRAVAATPLGEDFLYKQHYEHVEGRCFRLAI